MLIILRSRLLVMALVPVLFSVVACDKLTAVVGNLKKSQQTQSEKSEVNASFRSEQISNLSQADFAGFIARKDALVIVDFYADWCGPCKMLGPILEKAAAAHPGVVFLGKVNVDQARDLAAAQGVSGIPDVRIFKNGKEVDRFVGFPGEKRVLDQIATLAKGITPVASSTPVAKTPAEPTVQPFQKGWMPSGMKRQNSATH